MHNYCKSKEDSAKSVVSLAPVQKHALQCSAPKPNLQHSKLPNIYLCAIVGMFYQKIHKYLKKRVSNVMNAQHGTTCHAQVKPSLQVSGSASHVLDSHVLDLLWHLCTGTMPHSP